MSVTNKSQYQAERVAKLEAWASGHEDHCRERHADNKAEHLHLSSRIKWVVGLVVGLYALIISVAIAAISFIL